MADSCRDFLTSGTSKSCNNQFTIGILIIIDNSLIRTEYFERQNNCVVRISANLSISNDQLIVYQSIEQII